jgi:hypothetical protein
VGDVVLATRQVDDPARPLKISVRFAARGARAATVSIAAVVFKVNGRTVAGTGAGGRSASIPVTSLRIGGRFVNHVTAIVLLSDGQGVSLKQDMVILRCHTPVAACKRLGNGTRMHCQSNTPLGGRHVRVTVTRSAAETATGAATVKNGKYTVTVYSAVPLGAGVYAYKAVVTTDRPGERFQMIRRVTVR